MCDDEVQSCVFLSPAVPPESSVQTDPVVTAASGSGCSRGSTAPGADTLGFLS